MLSILAFCSSATGESRKSPAITRALQWVARTQRPDGGWPPEPNVPTSTWVTALVLLLPPDLLHPNLQWKPGLDWLLKITGRESGLLQHVRSVMITGKLGKRNPDGWSFFPDTAAWVTPTAFSLLALRKLSAQNLGEASEPVARRIAAGRDFLLARKCVDGGWNHGSSRALGYDSLSYPETTGLALVSLHGLLDATVLAPSLALAAQHLRDCKSLEGARWLELGLLSNRKPLEALKPFDTGGPSRIRLTQELALDVIARQAHASAQSGASYSNILIETNG